MKSPGNIFFEYPEKRDTVFIMGAGASYPEGVPLQRDILPLIVSGKIPEIENSEIGRAVKDFISNNFYFESISNSKYPRLEAVFGYLDYFLHQRESLSSYYTNSYIFNIKECLIKLMHFIVNIETDYDSKIYPLFWDAVYKNNPNISVITLNYDTLLEQAFKSLFYKNFYIDYCLHLMNYEKYQELEKHHFWINPREPLPVKDEANPKLIKIIKVHGSLNWKYCNCCNQVLLTPWDTKIDLQRNKFLGTSYPEGETYEFYCPVDGNEFQTLIMPPTYVKNLSQTILASLRNEAAREIRCAKKIVFIGYSLSNADIHIKALLKKKPAARYRNNCGQQQVFRKFKNAF